MSFAPLPASADEVEEIVTMWPAAMDTPGSNGPGAGARGAQTLCLIGPAAAEAAFKALARGHRALHLATHGFFLSGDCRFIAGARGVGGLKAAVTGPADRGPMENPLVLSGLVLAGANARDTVGPDEEDGLLTAEEIAALDLTGVEWVVLSACESGLGKVHAGEGVLGLRRAFQIAGAKTVIMSLWAIEDNLARAWMVELYRARFIDEMATADAVRRATRRILQARRSASISTHPYYWAGLVAAGDWR